MLKVLYELILLHCLRIAYGLLGITQNNMCTIVLLTKQYNDMMFRRHLAVYFFEIYYFSKVILLKINHKKNNT